MRRDTNPDLQKFTLRLFRSDVDAIAELHPTLPVNQVIRSVLSSYVQQERRKARAEQAALASAELAIL